jgi:alkylation response protein AidB-like acyl-CoA dehydrogenase
VDFELTDDQLELQRVVREIAEQECPPALVRAVIDGKGADGQGPDDALWQTYVGLDWPSLTVPEADGGMGLGAVELVIVLEELGRVVDPTPFLATASQYVPVVRACGDADQRGELLGRVCAGSTGAVAFTGDFAADRADNGWTVRGAGRWVLDGDRADDIAVVASTPEGRGVFVVPATEADAARTTTFDGTLHVADVALDDVAVGPERALLGDDEDGVSKAVDEATAGLAASMVGASQRVFELALAHIKDRKQFGAPIGSFQALKHMAADVYVALERARVLCHFAGLAIAEDDDRRSLAASMAKAAAGDAQRIAARHGIQFFGGLGYTWENDLHLYVRRAKAGELLLGTSAEHRARVAKEALAG